MEAVLNIIISILSIVLGWFLGYISSRLGSLKINFNETKVEANGHALNGQCTLPEGYEFCISFSIQVYNDKNVTAGINSCKIFFEYNSDIRGDECLLVYAEELTEEFKSLKNIEPKRMQEAFFQVKCRSDSCIKNYKLYMTYKINGSNMILRKTILKM